MRALLRICFAPAIIPAYTVHGALVGRRNASGLLRGAVLGSIFSVWYIATGSRLNVED